METSERFRWSLEVQDLLKEHGSCGKSQSRALLGPFVGRMTDKLAVPLVLKGITCEARLTEGIWRRMAWPCVQNLLAW